LTPHPRPLSSQNHWQETTGINGWRGEYREEGAEPPSQKSFPLSNIIKNGVPKTNLFEGGTKGVSKRTTIFE